ncbi:MAG: DUF2914 domain-containing protein [Nitrospinae bacterium]|nr:DUF2914 domain-containing protein [Nitrospinota bacterium]
MKMNMKKIVILILPILFGYITTVYSEIPDSEIPEEEGNLSTLTTASDISIARAVMAGSVEDREPIAEGVSFEPSLGKIYCFTHVVGAKSETSIRHVWYYKDKKMADILLPIKFPSHRTYSSKKILNSWTGSWRVEIRDKHDTILKTLNFTVK